MQTDRLSSHQGAGGSRPPVLPLEGIQSRPDDEFVLYIKDLKSQYDDSRATFTAEDLIVCDKNKYEAWLLDEENAWGKPTEKQEKIVTMSTEINSLKKEHCGTSSKTIKPKQTGKKQAAKEAAPKKLADKKKKETNTKENDTFVKTFENKKYFCSSTTTMVPACGHSTI